MVGSVLFVDRECPASTGWRPRVVAAPVAFVQKGETVMMGSMFRASSCRARTSFACEVRDLFVSRECPVMFVG